MSLYSERSQEGAGQQGSPRIRVSYMPDESQEGHPSGPNPNTTHSKIGNLIRTAAKSRVASRVGRVAASLGFLGGAVAAPTAIDAARAFAAGSSNRVEAPLQTGELAQEFKNIAVTREEALQNPVEPQAFTTVDKGNGTLLYMVPTLYDNAGNYVHKLFKSSPDVNGLPQGWVETQLPADFMDVNTAAAWDKFVVVGGQDHNYKGIAFYSSDEGKTFKKVPLPADTSSDTTTVDKVLNVDGMEYFFVNLRTLQGKESIYILDPQQDKVTPVENTGGTNTQGPVVGSQSGVGVTLYSLAFGESFAGVLKKEVDLYRGTSKDTILAQERGSLDAVSVKRDENNVITRLFAVKRIDRKLFELSPDTGAVLNPGKEYYSNWLANEYPGSILNIANSVDLLPNYDLLPGSLDITDGGRAVVIFRERNTGRLINYLFDPDFSDVIGQAVPTKIGGKNRLITLGKLARVVPLNDDKTPLDTDNPDRVYIGIKKAGGTATATPSPTATSTPTASATPDSSATPNSGNKKVYFPLVNRNKSGS